MLKEVRNKGKLIYFNFEEKGHNIYLYSNLGMTGEWGCVQKKHSHVCLKFEVCRGSLKGEHYSVFYTDVRRFGRLEVSVELDKINKLAKPVLSLFEPIITQEEFLLNLAKYENKEIVKILMDQDKVCSGIGNYLLSEVLHAAYIKPFSLIHEISDYNRILLYQACVRIAKESYLLGGVSLSDYLDFTGKEGKFSKFLKAYNNPLFKKVVGPHKRSIYTCLLK